jgi:hypothetical protein
MVRTAQLLKQTFAAALAILFLFSLPTGSHASEVAQQERTCKILESNWPKGVIEVKQINNLQSALFPTNFEIEVKNISNKPIYSIHIATIVHRSGGVPLGFHLDYGRRELFDFNHRIEDVDVPLLPGESHILKSDSQWRQDLLPMYKDNDAYYANDTNRISLVFQRLSFGDGTGYELNRPYPLRK